MATKSSAVHGSHPIVAPSITARVVEKATYVSGDELERANAFDLGYEQVCQHPVEVGRLGGDDKLVVDYDHVLFNDKAAAVRLARENARAGVPVGVHTYYPDDPSLAGIRDEPNVVVAKTHQDVLTQLAARTDD